MYPFQSEVGNDNNIRLLRVQITRTVLILGISNFCVILYMYATGYGYIYSYGLFCILRNVYIVTGNVINIVGRNRNMSTPPPEMSRNQFRSTINRGAPRLDNVTECSICKCEYAEITDPFALQCGHVYCEECIYCWYMISKSCPDCRRPITRNSSPA